MTHGPIYFRAETIQVANFMLQLDVECLKTAAQSLVSVTLLLADVLQLMVRTVIDIAQCEYPHASFLLTKHQHNHALALFGDNLYVDNNYKFDRLHERWNWYKINQAWDRYVRC
jgi:hypothetical protein